MTIKDETHFWQAVMDIGYAMEGENKDYERGAMVSLSETLNRYLREHSIDINSDVGFAIVAVTRLAGAFAFNDRIEPRKAHIIDAILKKVSHGNGGDETQH